MPPLTEGEIRPGDPKKQPAPNEHSAFAQLNDAVSSSSAKPGETRIIFQPPTGQSSDQPRNPSAAEAPTISHIQSSLPRDIKQWPETGGYPPIMGGSGQEDRGDAEARNEGARAFWEQFLRANYPERSEKDIQREVEENMQDPELVDWAIRLKKFQEKSDKHAKEANIPTYFETLRRIAEEERKRKKG